MSNLAQLLQRHSVALVSLAVAMTGLGYNTWRNEQTEANRNVRTAGFEILLKLGELDRIVFFSHYDRDSERGSPRAGWAYVLTVRDLGDLTDEPATSSARLLVDAWKANWPGLGKDDASAAAISEAIDRTRQDINQVLASLD